MAYVERDSPIARAIRRLDPGGAPSDDDRDDPDDPVPIDDRAASHDEELPAPAPVLGPGYVTLADAGELSEERYDVETSCGNSSDPSSGSESSDRVLERMLRGPSRGPPRARGPRHPRHLRCFGCSHRARGENAANGSNLNTLIRMMEDGYGRLDNRLLARQCHLYFKRYIHEPMASIGTPLRMWTSRSILLHITEHMQDPRIFVGESICTYKRIRRALEDKMFVRRPLNGGWIVSPDHQAIKTHIAVSKQLMSLYSASPEKMNFYDKDCGIDLKRSSGMIRPHGDFVLE